ncbi:phage tail protein, partial [Escherichia coli]|nr:phage tail protein [Escherichia coli]
PLCRSGRIFTDFAMCNCFSKNLGLGAGAPAIGIPFFWPSVAMPNTVMDEWSDMVFLKFNGATFSALTYPKLALIFPELTLPEARGEFPRIWDDGRGTDSGRALLSTQGDAMRNITGKIPFAAPWGFEQHKEGAFFGTQFATGGGGSVEPSDNGYGLAFDASVTVPTASEIRPRNIAFNFLVRAK